MKSMLHEASTVVKAIEKAWIDSGKPLEFTINIHEVGEKNFLGFTKRPAIVSITYDPKRQPSRVPDRREAPTSHPKPSPRTPVARPKPEHKAEPVSQQGRQAPSRQQAAPNQRFSGPSVKPEPQISPMPQVSEDFWTADLIHDISIWFKESVRLLGENVPFEVNAEKRMLRVTFERSLLASSEDERQLFIGLSYLLLQCLKKKHKKKLRGYHLIISSKHHGTTDNASSH